MPTFILLAVLFTIALIAIRTMRTRIALFFFERRMRKYNASVKRAVHGAKEFTASYSNGSYNV